MELDTGTMSNTLDDYAGDHMWIRNNYFYNEIHIAHLTSENVTLHDLSYGKATWIVRSEYAHSSDEVMVQGQPVMRSTHITFCHCNQCDWSWFLRGWKCWYTDDRLTTGRLALHDLISTGGIWVAYYATDHSSGKLVEYERTSVSIETVLTGSTETKLRINWNRSGLVPCPCGRCQLHWFQYGWKCWPVRIQ